MAQVSYGTITITDTNDVESIVVEYNRNQSTTTPPAQTDSGWSTTRPAWAQGYYIWQRTRTHKSGTQASEDVLGNAVCITGSTGQTGTSITISSIKYAISTTESQPADSSFTYTSVPTVAEGSWLWTLTTYSNGNKMYTKSKQGTSGTSVTVSSVKYAISEEDITTDKQPYHFRKSPSGEAKDEVIVGGSLGWNQLQKNTVTRTNNGITYTFANGKLSVSGTATAQSFWLGNSSDYIWGFVKDHIYLFSTGSAYTYVDGNNPFWYVPSGFSPTVITAPITLKKCTSTVSSCMQYAVQEGSEVNSTFEPQCIDLTTCFGSTIADYIYSLETATAGAGVAWVKRYIDLDTYHEYDAGSIQSVEGLVSHDVVGFNQWDEEWELGNISDPTGQNLTADNVIRSKNYISVLGDTDYYYRFPSAARMSIFYYDANKNYISNYGGSETAIRKTPASCRFVRFRMNSTYGTTYNHDICINLSDPSRNGQYEPYEKHSYPLDSSVTLRGVPKLVTDHIEFDGDRYRADGTLERRYGIVVLDGTQNNFGVSAVNDFAQVSWNGYNNIGVSKAIFVSDKFTYADSASGAEGRIYPSNSASRMFLGLPSTITTAAQAQAWFASNPTTVIYPLATPATETATPFQSPMIVGATEEYVSDSVVPVGHESKYYLGTTTQPADNEFTYDNPPNVQDGQWLWVRTIYSDNSKTYLKTRQGFSGESGRSLSNTITEYTTATNSATITESNMGSYTWSENVPNYSSSTPAYWVRVTNRYSNPVTVEYIIYKDNGITDAMATAAAANSTANQANQTANTANQTANSASTKADNAYNIATGISQHFWTIATDYATGLPAGSYITDTAIDTFKSQKTGGNLLTRSDGIWLRDGIKTLASLTGTSLTFYNPSSNSAQLIIGANGTLQSGNYSRGSDSKFSSNGTKIDLVNGDIITKYFRVSQGLESGLTAGVYVHGTIEALDGTIGTDSTNYWEIGNGTDYNLNSTAKMIGHGSSYIQLGDSSTWRLATNRIHTGWYVSSDSLLHFPAIDSKYWDFGVHTPTASAEKFLYIRKSKANTSASNALTNLLYDIDDSYATPQWDYVFYISANGSLYAKNLYVLDDNGNAIQIGGTDGVYLLKSGGTITGNLEVNGNLTKGGKTVAYLTTTPANGQILIADGTSGSIKTSGYTIATSVPSGAVFTDKNVQTSQANTTKIYLAGTSTTGTTTGTLSYDSNVYLTTTAGTLHATTFEGNLSGTATKANQDGDGNVIKTTYLKLSGGQVTGPVSFGDSVSADSLNVGDLIVSGAGRFANGLYGNLIGNADSATKVGKDLKIQFNGGTTEGTNQFTFNGSVAETVNLTKSSVGLGNVENKSSATIRGELTSSNVTTALGFTPYNATNPNGYTTNTGTVTSIRIQATSPVVSSVSTASSTTLDTTISLANAYGDTKNPYGTKTANYVLAGPSSGNAAVPTFRALVAADIPSITKSKISDFPTTLKNPNALKVRIYSGTTTPTDTSYDGGTANQSVEVAGKGAIVGLTAGSSSSASDVTTFTLTKADGTSSTFDVSIIASEATGATALKDSSGLINKGSATKPVYFSSGVPVEGSTYAGGTAVTLNGGSKSSSTASFYAPTTAGTSGQVLTSSGGAPGWTNQSSLSVGSATKATQDSDGSVINTTYLKLAGGKMTGGLEISGHINCGNGSASNLAWTQGGGGYHYAYNNIVLHGDATTGSSGIAFISDKGSTNINAPSDRAFIQFHAYGITTATGEGTNPTLATSGEINRLVIGVGNDVTDEVWLQTPATYGLKHQVGSTTYTIPSVASYTTTANYPVISTTAGGVHAYNTSITMNGGTITATTFDGNATSATESNKLKYYASLTTDEAIDGFLEANRFRTALWTSTSSVGGVTNGVILSGAYSSTKFGFQLAIDDDPTYFIALRQKDNNGWADWKRIPMADGTGASGNWSINANTATTATYSYYPKFVANNELRFDVNSKPSSAINLCVGYKWSDGTSDAKINRYNFYNGGTGLAEVGASTFYGDLSGNATSATKAIQDASGNVITSTYLKLSGGTMAGPLQWTSASLPEFSGSPLYLVGIEAFASGGTMKWKSTSNITVGNATTATNLTAGTATNDYRPIWFTANNTNQRAVNDYLTFRNDTKDLKIASLSISAINNVTARANIRYDSTLEAIVFSFS